MKILITGSEGFIGKNLSTAFLNIRDGKDVRHYYVKIDELYLYDINSSFDELDAYCADCDFVFSFAGVNRPKHESDFLKNNSGFVSLLLDKLKKHRNFCPVMFASSSQAVIDNLYGNSKKAGEELLFAYMRETGAKTLVYRFPNVFGKWCKPNYNSAIATFCYNTANDLPITVNDPSVEMDLVYIDDLIEEMISALTGNENRTGNYCSVPVSYKTNLGFIADTVRDFKQIRESLCVPDLSDPLVSALYSTWLSYLPPEKFIYDLNMKSDPRGSFTEIIRTADRGQFSVNISRPGITKGQHWHHSKNEKFVVVSGKASIRLRRLGCQPDGSDYPVCEFKVSGKKIQVVEMVPGYVHSIENISDSEDLVTIMWSSETFDPDKPDTYFQKV